MSKMILHPKIQALKRRSAPFEIADALWGEIAQVRAAKESLNKKLADNQKLAYYCVWGVRDTYGTGWIRGAFDKSISERGPQSDANQKIFASFMHNVADPIGRCVEMGSDDFGAWAVVEFDDPEAVPSAKRALSQLNSGTINGWSFGFRYVWDKMEYDEATDTIWVKEAMLFEVSPTTLPSMVETYTVRNAADFDMKKQLFDEDVEFFIKQLPKSKQLELRELMFRHRSLIQSVPTTSHSLGKPDKGVMKLGSLNVNINNL